MIKYKPLVVTGKSSFRKSFTCTNPTYASSDTFITILLPKVVMDWKVAFGKQMNFVHQQTKIYIYARNNSNWFLAKKTSSSVELLPTMMRWKQIWYPEFFTLEGYPIN